MVKNSVTDIQIYHNPGLIDLIKTAFFNGLTGFGYKFKQYYVSSHLEHKEPELTIPIVALGATAVSNLSIVVWIITDSDMMIQVLCSAL